MNIKTRMRLAIEDKTTSGARYVELMAKTGISSNVWKNFWFERKEPDAVMVEALGLAWPEYALWITTGATDISSGHHSPKPLSESEKPGLYERFIDVFHAIWGNSCLQAEKDTGIMLRRWQGARSKHQKPSFDMLQAMAKVRPQYTAWLMCGEAALPAQLIPQKAPTRTGAG